MMTEKKIEASPVDTHEHNWEQRKAEVLNILRSPSIVVFYVCTICGAWHY